MTRFYCPFFRGKPTFPFHHETKWKKFTEKARNATTMVALDGLPDLVHPFGGNVAGNISALFIALVVVIGSAGALAQDVERASLHVLDLSDVVENRWRSGFCIHRGMVYV